MNDIERAKDALADASSLLDSIIWILEDRDNERNLLSMCASLRKRLDIMCDVL